MSKKLSPAPDFDLETEFKLHEALSALIKTSLLESAHDISDGGLFVALTESAMNGSIGFDVRLPENVRKDVFLFSESQSRAVVSVSLENIKTFEALLHKQANPFHRLGTVQGSALSIDGDSFGEISQWNELYQNALTLILEQ